MSDISRTYPFAGTSHDSTFSMQIARTAGLPLDLQRIKKASGIGFIAFSLIFILIAQWFLIPTLMSGLFRTTQSSTVEQDPAILKFLEKEGKLKLSSYTVVKSNKPYAAIGGIPGFPKLYLSSTLIDTFSTEEMHYVLMHEVGHVARQHTLREVLLMVAIISMVWSLFAKIHLWQKPRKTQLILACIVAVFLGIIMVQFERIHEFEADYFAIEHLKDPQGMLTASQKLRVAWGTPEHQTFLRELFYRGVPYDAKVSIAQAYSIPKNTIIRPATLTPTPEPLLSVPAAESTDSANEATSSSFLYDYGATPTPQATPVSFPEP